MNTLVLRATLVGACLVGCATPSTLPPTRPAATAPSPSPASMASPEYPSTAALLTDVVGKIHEQYVVNVSVERLTILGIQGLETLGPRGVIQVMDEGSRARITHSTSGLPESTLSVSWPPASPTPADAGRALDEAGQFVARRLDANPSEVLDAVLRGLISVDPAGAYLNPAASGELSGAGLAG